MNGRDEEIFNGKNWNGTNLKKWFASLSAIDIREIQDRWRMIGRFDLARDYYVYWANSKDWKETPVGVASGLIDLNANLSIEVENYKTPDQIRKDRLHQKRIKESQERHRTDPSPISDDENVTH